jgi:hypothetical protein
VTPAEIQAWTERSRASQGLPPKVTDPAILGKVITLAFVGDDAKGEGDDHAP